jgi:L-ascorbate metabolism protein UlaG (beta-lactamase superfamily)
MKRSLLPSTFVARAHNRRGAAVGAPASGFALAAVLAVGLGAALGACASGDKATGSPATPETPTAPDPGPGPAGPGPTVRWFGQSAFLVTTPGGTRVLMDPIPADLGYVLPPPVEAHVVTISHEHFDHTNVAMAAGTPEVIRGLTADKNGWEKVDRTIGDVHVRTVGVYHDGSLGKERGLNAVFVLEFAGWRVAHLGDLGHLLTAEQIAAIGPLDVLLIPVGGTFTIDADAATKVVAQLRPRTTIIPMHYKTPALKPDLPLAPVDAFLTGKPKVRHVDGTELKVAPLPTGAPAEIVVMNYL